MIGLEVKGRCEVVCAATGEGCYCNGRRSWVSSAQTLEGGVLSFTDAASFEERGREEALPRLRRAAGGSRGWSAPAAAPSSPRAGSSSRSIPSLTPGTAPYLPILHEARGFVGDGSGDETIYAGEALSPRAHCHPRRCAS